MNEFRPGRYQALPPIVKNLIIINVIMVLLQFILARTFHVNLQDYLGLHYMRSHLFKPWQLVTHIFMHGSPYSLDDTILHIFSNMFALWMFGSILENRWGPKRFLIFYLICGIGASLCYMGTLAVQFEPLYKSFHLFRSHPTQELFGQILQKYHLALDPSATNIIGARDAVMQLSKAMNSQFDGPMVGASGAVFGVLFAFGYLFPNTELMLIFPPIPIKAKWIVTGYALLELYAAWQNAPDDNVAHFAHIGGMLVAFIILKIWQQDKRHFY